MEKPPALSVMVRVVFAKRSTFFVVRMNLIHFRRKASAGEFCGTSMVTMPFSDFELVKKTL